MDLKQTICLLAVICLLDFSNAFMGDRYWKFRNLVQKNQERSVQQALRASYNKYGYSRSETKTYFLEQPLDHFNAISKEFGKTYKQRYYVNANYWFGSESPVFLFIGGEGTLTSGSIQAGEMVELAKAHNALLVGAEHRYYGASINEDGLQLEELQYLSSQQALADLATLTHHIKTEYGIPDTTPWICFGGSYPGALSAWFRLKYPHLVAGAVASSAPVQAQTNFEGYNMVVAASLNNTLVGGSPKCLDAVTKAFQQIDTMVSAGQFDQLQTDFKSCNPLSMREDTVLFVSNLASYFMGIVQYNKEIPDSSIASVCNDMLSISDPYQSLVQINKQLMKLYNETCVDNCYMKYVSTMSNTTVNKQSLGAGMRQWTFQTCSQFGYYQTCDKNTTCPFSHLMDLQDSGLDICQKVFKIDPLDVDKNVQFSNDYYGGNHTRQSNIVFVNGSIDPWHWLSVLVDQEQFGEYSVFIPGTAHCADLGIPKASDPPALTQARERIASLVSKFLEDSRTRQ